MCHHSSSFLFTSIFSYLFLFTFLLPSISMYFLCSFVLPHSGKMLRVSASLCFVPSSSHFPFGHSPLSDPFVCCLFCLSSFRQDAVSARARRLKATRAAIASRAPGDDALSSGREARGAWVMCR